MSILTPALDGGLPGGPVVEFQLTTEDVVAFRLWSSDASGKRTAWLRRNRLVLTTVTGLATFFLVLFVPIAFGVRSAAPQLWVISALAAAAVATALTWVSGSSGAGKLFENSVRKRTTRNIGEHQVGRRRVSFHPLGLIVESAHSRTRFDWWAIIGVAQTPDHAFVRLRTPGTPAVVIPRRVRGADGLTQAIEQQLRGRDVTAILTAISADPTHDWGPLPAGAVQYELTEAEELTALHWKRRHGYFDSGIRRTRALILRRMAAPLLISLAVCAVGFALGPLWMRVGAVIYALLVSVPALWIWLVVPSRTMKLYSTALRSQYASAQPQLPTRLWLDDDGVNLRSVGRASHTPWWRLYDLDDSGPLVLWRAGAKTIALPRRADPVGTEQIVTGLRAGIASAQTPVSETTQAAQPSK